MIAFLIYLIQYSFFFIIINTFLGLAILVIRNCENKTLKKGIYCILLECVIFLVKSGNQNIYHKSNINEIPALRETFYVKFNAYQGLNNFKMCINLIKIGNISPNMFNNGLSISFSSSI